MRFACSLILLLAVLPGCRLGESIAEYRARDAAEWSWHRSRSLYESVPHTGTFADGYKTGFIAVSTGGDPNAQPTPPGRLRTMAYRSGWEQQQAWYDGYSHGVLAALDEQGRGSGTRNHTTLETSVIHDGITEEFAHGPVEMEESVPFATTPTDLPTMESHGQPSELLHKVDSEPKFVPPPPAPPEEEAKTGKRGEAQPVSHTESAKTEAKQPGMKRPITPPLTLDTRSNDETILSKPGTKRTGVATKAWDRQRAEWGMPIIHAKAGITK